MLAHENSFRVKSLLANMFFVRYYEMYPRYHDLGLKHKKRIRNLGGSSLKIQGGTVFTNMNRLLGWRLSKRIKEIIYQVGYRNLVLEKRR